MTTIEPTDGQLWAEAVEGNPAAFGMLFDRHARALYNHCFRLTASWSDAEDLAQVTFLTAWRKRDRVRLANDSALPWLLAVATNVVRSHRRSLRRRLSLRERAHAERPALDHADDVAERLDAERRMATLLAAVERLPRAEREAIALVAWSGLSHADAATALGIAEVSVRSRLSRARSRLARLLSDGGHLVTPTPSSRES